MFYFILFRDRLNGGSVASHFASKYKGPSSMGCRERRSHARGVYPTQYTSHMRTARVKQEVERDTRIMQQIGKKSGRN